MGRRAVITAAAVVWSVVGAVVALGELRHVNSDARLFVAIASIGFPLCALAGAVSLRSGRDRLAGLLLLLSVATPTYFAYPLNLPALGIGLGLLCAPRAVAGPSIASRVAGPFGQV